MRRKFNDALEVSGKGKKSPTAAQGVAYCTKLFKIEEQLKDLTPEERQKKRSEQAKPVLTAILAWSKTRTAAPKSKLGIALNYLKNQWPTLITYLEDGRIELSNNRAERSIKPFVREWRCLKTAITSWIEATPLFVRLGAESWLTRGKKRAPKAESGKTALLFGAFPMW